MAKNKEPPKEGITYLLLPPDGGYGWVVTFAGFLAMFLGEGTMCSFGLYMDQICADMQTTEKVISFANSTMSGFYFVFGPIMCSLVNRFGYRFIGISGGIVAGGAFYGASYLNDPISFIFVFGAIGGIGFSMLYFSSVLVVAVYFERWRGVAISIALCGGTAGSMAIPQIILIAFKGYTWRIQFQYFAVMAVLCGCVTLLYKPLEPFEIKTTQTEKPKIVPEGDDISEFLQLYTLQSDDSLAKSTKSARSNKSIKTLKSRISVGQQATRIRSASARIHPKETSCAICCKNLWTGRWCRQCSWDIFCLGFCELCCCCVLQQRCCILRGRPMARKDILYTASVNTIAQHKKMSETKMGMLEYHMSVTAVTPMEEVHKDRKICICCPASIADTLSTMLDISVTKIPSFNLIMLNSFLITMAYYSPPIFITQKAKLEGVPEVITNLLLSIFGGCALLGRILCVLLSSFPQVNMLMAIGVSCVLCGLCIISNNCSSHYINHIVTMVVFGVCGAICYSLRTPMIVQLYGVESLSSSFGLCMVGYGVAGFIGVPLAAIIYDQTDSYKAIFYYIGGVALLSGILIFPVQCMRPRELRKEEARKESQPSTSPYLKK